MSKQIDPAVADHATFALLRDVSGAPLAVSLRDVIVAQWIQRMAPGPGGKPVPIAGSRTLAITTREVAQGTSISRYIHPDDARELWAMLHAQAVDLRPPHAREQLRNGDAGPKIVDG